jgi:Reductase C-terminal
MNWPRFGATRRLEADDRRRVVRGDPATRAFSTFGFRDGKFAVVESVNRKAPHRHDEDANTGRSSRPGV